MIRSYLFSSVVLAFLAFNISSNAGEPFVLNKLPYSYDALEPYIDAKTMEIHYSRHHAGYVNNLNQAVKGTNAENLSLEEMMKHISDFSVAVRNNGGGHYNHTLFWSVLTPKETSPSESLIYAINRDFGSMDKMKEEINQAAASRFGSGWAWLYVDPDGFLMVSSTPNQDNPLMDIVEKQGIPILGIDVWEHAYYLKYQNKRADYLQSVWHVMNWDEVSRRYKEAIAPEK
jgi:superoxide dismutase, Fe-Mn family